MEILLTNTVLKDVEQKAGPYPKALQTAKHLLIKEQENLIPIYGGCMLGNYLEARGLDAEKQGLIAQIEESLRANQIIKAVQGYIRGMVTEMAVEWGSSFAWGVLLSQDVFSSDPAITRADGTGFSFKFSSKRFNLGLTGRILKDAQGRQYKENLLFASDIYDAYNLAIKIHPETICSLDNHGIESVIYEKGQTVGKMENLDFPEERICYYFSEDQLREPAGRDKTEVLPTNGLEVSSSEFWRQISRYKESTFLFGHKYSSGKEFLEMARILNQHIIWDICASEAPGCGYTAPLMDCEKFHGDKLIEGKNRLQLIPNRVGLYFGRVSLSFNNQTAISALMSLEDAVTDLWFEPVNQKRAGWDIVYDKRRGIRPEKPVAVMGRADYERYAVLKGRVV